MELKYLFLGQPVCNCLQILALHGISKMLHEYLVLCAAPTRPHVVEERMTPASSQGTPSPSRSPSPLPQQPQAPAGEIWPPQGHNHSIAPTAKALEFDPQRPLSGKPIPQAQVDNPNLCCPPFTSMSTSLIKASEALSTSTGALGVLLACDCLSKGPSIQKLSRMRLTVGLLPFCRPNQRTCQQAMGGCLQSWHKQTLGSGLSWQT